jgi:hypothetical protein
MFDSRLVNYNVPKRRAPSRRSEARMPQPPPHHAQFPLAPARRRVALRIRSVASPFAVRQAVIGYGRDEEPVFSALNDPC